MTWLTKQNMIGADILQRHHHSNEQTYGSNSGFMAADNNTKFVVTGGNNAWGTELHIHAGDVIGGGNPLYSLDLNTMFITDVSSANKVSTIEFLYTTAVLAITGITIDETGGAMEDMFTKAGHGLVNGDKLVFTSVTTTTGITSTIVYYVVGMVGDNFQVSLTSGGAAVAVTGDGSCSILKLTQSSLTKTVVSMSNTTSDAAPLPMNSLRVPCNTHISVRAKSESGSTIGISFLLALHTYNF